MKIIVRMPNWLGDLVMSTPTLEALRKKYPKAKITAMCQSNVADLLIGNPHVDEIFKYQRPKNGAEKKALIKEIQKENFDLGILLTNSLSSAWWFFRGKVKKRIGFACNLRSIFLTKAIPFPKNRKSQHLIFTYLALLSSSDKPNPKLFIEEQERGKVKQFLIENGLKEGQKIIGLSPGAAFGTAKRWLPERFRELGEMFDQNHFVICTGNKNEADLSKTICEKSTIVNLVGKTSLRELIVLIDLCDGFVANDSGPMHIAAALNTPLIAIFGPTDEKVSGPHPNGEVIHKHVSCSPCHLRECPKDHICMKSISAQEIYEKFKKRV